MCNKCREPQVEPSAKDWKYCRSCGKDLVVKEASEPFEFNPVTGAKKYFTQLICPNYNYPNHTRHTSTGYNVEVEREEKF